MSIASSLVGPSRKRTSCDDFALEIRPVQSSQLVRNAQATSRGRRMRSARGALPRYTYDRFTLDGKEDRALIPQLDVQ